MSNHTSLAAALLAFQQKPPHIELDSTNPHFRSKFAGLPGITKAVKPRLSEEGLVYAQPLDNIEGAPAIRTIVFHPASGETLESITPLLLGGKTDPQSHGSAVTYARRYALLSILGLVGDEDDDGNAASSGKPSAPTPAHQGKIGDASGGAAPVSPDAGAEALDFGADAPHPEAAPKEKPKKGKSAPGGVKKAYAILKSLEEVDSQFDALIRPAMVDEYGTDNPYDMTEEQVDNLIPRMQKRLEKVLGEQAA